MTSREIVRRTLSFEGPARVARSFGESDIVFCGCTARTCASDWRETVPGRWERLDEWGNTWARLDTTSKGEVARGALDDLADVGRIPLPDFSRPEDYADARRLRAEHADRWLVGGLPGFAFNIARKLRRLEQYLVDILADPEPLRLLHDRIDGILEPMIRNFAEAGCDAVMITEDWGTQTQLLIPPDLWAREFRPRFDRLCGLAHGLGLSVWMHSCGQTEAIVPGLMEAGVDLLQFDQPELHGLENLAAHQGRGRITFWCPVDIQTTLQTRDEAPIRARARAMLDLLWRGRGGFIAGYYGDNVAIGLDPRFQAAACDEFVTHGVAATYGR